MIFEKWNENKNYDHLDGEKQYRHFVGHIPVGTKVRFRDGDTGTVRGGNFERSLVSYPATGGGTNNDYFDNEQLEVPTE